MKCEQCGDDFTLSLWTGPQPNPQKYCNRSCRDKAFRLRKGIKSRILKCECGSCKTCTKRIRARDWRKNGNGKARDIAYNIKRGQTLDPNSPSRVLINVLLEIIKELRMERRAWNPQRAHAEFSSEAKRRKRYQSVFYHKIWQPCVCADCGVEFETIQPIEWVALDISNGMTDIQRCKPCQKIFRLLNHGGGPRRRCKVYGVPCRRFNARVIFIRDSWKCKNCGVPTPESKRGSQEPDAPELDHIWPLSQIRNGVKSPGHVKSNCQLLCRKCNGVKGAK